MTETRKAVIDGDDVATVCGLAAFLIGLFLVLPALALAGLGALILIAVARRS